MLDEICQRRTVLLSQRKSEMKIVAISDIHGNLPGKEKLKDYSLPEADVLCICGDIVPLEFQRDLYLSEYWFNNVFGPWAADLPYKKILVIPGNHDFYLYDQIVVRKITPVGFSRDIGGKTLLLCDNCFDYEGISFHGTPWVPDLKGWAFYKNEEELYSAYSKIPKVCDVLLTHCPPAIGSQGTILQRGYNYMSHFGSKVLADILYERDIRIVLSGHVHTGAHFEEYFENHTGHTTTLRNVSLLDEDYRVSYNPFVFKL